MALSVDENLALFDILDVPYFDGTNPAGYSTMDGMGTLASQTTMSGSTQTSAVAAINAWITAMSVGTLSNLQKLLARYVVLGTGMIRVEAGNVGDVTAVTMNPQEERGLITEMVRRRVPFYRYHDVLAQKAGSDGGLNGQVSR